MLRGNSGGKVAVLLAAVPVIGAAQTPLPFGDQAPSADTSLTLGGRASMDLIRLESGKYGFPLRFANVRLGSERIDVAGLPLVKGVDYTIDYATGVVYILRPFSDGQSMRVQYKYDDRSNQVGLFAPQSSEGSGFSGLRLEFSPQSSIFLGLGMTERLNDGTVLSSNVYGVSNAYSMGGGTLKGVFMVGERARSGAQSMFGAYAQGRKQSDEGTGSAIVQNFTSNLLGGKVNVDYQDIDKRFAAFESLKQNGFSDQDALAMQKERGLKRAGLSLTDVGTDALKFSSGFRSVGDANGSINWRNFGFASNGLSFGFASQSVDKSFRRFGDLKEADREMLQREQGLDRETMNAMFARNGASLSFNSFVLDDPNGNGISRRLLGLESKFGKLSYSEQSVDEGFTQFQGLRPEYDASNKFDVGQMQREIGLDRKNLTGETKLGGADLKFSQGSIDDKGKGLDSKNATLKIGGATIEHKSVGVDEGFQRFTSLTPQEQQEAVKTIAEMVAPGLNPGQNDVPLFSQNSGLDRELWRLKYDFGGGVALSVADSSIDGANDDLLSQAYALSGPNYHIDYRAFNVGDGFGEVSKLLQSEQSVYGTEVGLSKSDLRMDYAFGKNAKFTYAQMEASVAGNEASRRAFGFEGKGISVNWSKRSVDDGFAQVGRLMDPEQGLLSSLIGFDQESLVAKWQLLPQIGLSLNWAVASNSLTGEDRTARETSVDWKVTPETTVTAYRAEQSITSDDTTLIDRELDRLMVSHNLGRLGIVSLLQEQRRFDGDQDELPDSIRNQVGYKASITKSTQFETEQSETRFVNGDRETATTNTISTHVTDRVGVSVTDTKILRDGDKPDANKRDYGFWMDFGKNVRLTYGSARNLLEQNNGTENLKAGLSAGQFAGIDVKSLQYTQDIWDGKRNRSVGDVNLKTVKPLDWGSIDNVEFFYLIDTIHDMDTWQKENRSMGLSGSVGNLSIGFGYRSQISPNGDRAIDRVLSLNTDKSGKAAIRAELNYDLRTMPSDQTIAVRDLKLVARPFKGWEFEHSMLTNPLKQDDRALLGGIAQDTRVNNWRINWLTDPNFKAGFVFEELRNDRTNLLSRKSGFDLTLFAKNPSPLSLGYRSVLSGANANRSTAHEFWLRYDQRPGPNQSLSLMFGNMNYEGFRPSSQSLQNWSMRLDYGFRF